MNDKLGVINMLGHATGTVLFLLLVALTIRARRFGKANWRWTFAALSLWLWSFGNFSQNVFAFFGCRENCLPSVLSIVAVDSSASFVTTGFLLLLKPKESAESWRKTLYKYAIILSFVVATIYYLLSMSIDFFPEASMVSGEKMMQIFLYNVLLHVCIYCFLVRRRDYETRLQSNATYAMIGLFCFAGLLGLILDTKFLSPDSSRLLAVLLVQMTLPIGVAAFLSFAPFRFADVFIKQSLTILLAVALAFLFSNFLSIGWETFFAPRKYAQTASGVLSAIIWCSVLLVFPLLIKFIGQTVDRFILRRPDYHKLLQNFVRDAQICRDAIELETLVCKQISVALNLPNARFLSQSNAPENSFSIPLRVRGEICFVLLLNANKEQLYSEDFAFLEKLVERIERQFEQFEFERERREREMSETLWHNQVTEAKLRALRAQVNPHFLFNTLNTIAEHTSSNPEQAELMTERLAEVFRYVLAQSERNFNTVREEFDFLRNYLEIEQVRFGARLQVEILLDEQIADQLIPSLLLQPLVENSLKHGLAPKLSGGKLQISAFLLDQKVCLEIMDEGVGIKQTSDLATNRFGLRSVRERLQMLHGEAAEISLNSELNNGTTIQLLFPRQNEHEIKNSSYRRRSGGAFQAQEIAFGTS